MAIKEINQFYQDLELAKDSALGAKKKWRLDPIYFLCGEESFLIENATRDLREIYFNFAVSGLEAFNFELLYGSEVSVDAILGAVETLPVMDERRLVILKQAHLLKDSEWEQLAPLFENPIEHCLFIIVSEKFDKRKKYAKKIVQSSVFVEFKAPYENQLPYWIRTLAKRHNLIFSNVSLDHMYRFCGTNLFEIDSELQKLKAYLWPKQEVTVSDINEVVSNLKFESMFALADAVGKKDKISALYEYERLRQQNESEIAIVSILARHFRLLLVLQMGLSSKKSQRELGLESGLSPFFLQNYLDQSKLWTQLQVERALVNLAGLDYRLKSSSLPAYFWLEDYILKSS